MTAKGRLRRTVLVTLGLVLLLVPVASAGAAEDPSQQRREVRSRQAEVAAHMDVLRADVVEVEAALAAVSADVRAQEQAVANTQRAIVAAAAEVEQARLAGTEVAARITALEAAAREHVVAAYVRDPGATALHVVTGDVRSSASRRFYASLGAARAEDAVDELQGAREDLGAWEQRAAAAQARAEAQRSEEDARLADLAVAQDRQAQLLAGIEDRLDASLGEAAALEQLDQQLSAEIRRREEELAQRLAAEAATRAARAQREAAQRAAETRPNRTPSTTAGTGGGSSGPGPSGQAPAGPGSLTTVRGITVASLIADQLEALLAAAEADGIVLGGGGYRDSAGQIATRRANCGTSDYAIYEMPSSACRPPTARPGRSMHERGLAIDFTYNGRVIASRSSPAFQWLAANAGRFGLKNMPAEPWHWSTNGN